MKRVALAAGIIVLLGAGTFAFVTTEDAADRPAIFDAAISRGDITEAVAATGTLDALRTVPIGSQVSGIVKEVDADYNSIVRAGQVIARLDPSLLQVQVEIQQANIARQQTDIDSQAVQLKVLQDTAARSQALYDQHLIDRATLDTDILNVKVLQATIESATKMLVQAQANLDQAKLNVSYCTIRSPIDGVVIQRQVDVGQTVQASMTTPQFFVLATDLTQLKLTAGIDEADIGKIRPDQDVTFTVDAYKGVVFHGTVDSVRLNAVTTSNVVTYETIVDVANPDLRLRPSMTATVKILVRTVPDVLRVPNLALRFRPTSEIASSLGTTLPPAALAPASGHPSQATAGAPGVARRAASGVTAAAAAAAAPAAAGRKIDEFFAPIPVENAPASVWTWNASTRQLTRIPVRVGVTDGELTQLLSGPLQPGDLVLTSVQVPAAARPAAVRSPLMGPQRGGFRGRGF